MADADSVVRGTIALTSYICSAGFIDHATRVLTAPFRAVVHFGSQWAEHGFVTLCALPLYGVGLGHLARYSQGLASNTHQPSRRS